MNKLKPIPSAIFASRWLQLPFYVGLILIQALYAARFVEETFHLIVSGMALGEAELMLAVLSLIDVVLISNLLMIVIIGGYETYVSRMRLENHPDEPQWLGKMGTGTLKIKLALALVSISSIHLLEVFIKTDRLDDRTIMWKVAIHLTLIVSALLISLIDKLERYKPETNRKP